MPQPSVLVLVAEPGQNRLRDDLVQRSRLLAGGGEPRWLSSGEAVELSCAPEDPDALLSDVRDVIGPDAVDALLVPTANRRKRLLVADMDSTIVRTETLDDLAVLADRTLGGVGEAVTAITRRSMNGELDFAPALRERVALLRGLPADTLEAVWRHTQDSAGARTLVATMRAHGAHTALVSGGFTWFTGRVAERVGFHEHHANRLGIGADERLDGTVGEPILGRDAKRDTLLRLAAAHGLAAGDAIAVGDGANDLAMLGVAGMGIAFHPKPVVANAVRNRVVHGSLRALLFAQGYEAAAFRD
ncbi:phosphoserine phosphatase SerB [Rhizosaccharibacter radicis]|uniref:Phosphoserine phosphatase n=1 Tax=Rhizosaccharibacter radicis TaxID=2782605 RepID=A0ABT1W147_9PROT|nr:phosphoserine phosphatase SerB [Acetobacteraceae bacterium KSS12]